MAMLSLEDQLVVTTQPLATHKQGNMEVLLLDRYFLGGLCRNGTFTSSDRVKGWISVPMKTGKWKIESSITVKC
jgi:hypothetical protein